jgi:hypothetical protein
MSLRRPYASLCSLLPDELLKVLYGFDAVVILSSSGPQHDSLQPR